MKAINGKTKTIIIALIVFGCLWGAADFFLSGQDTSSKDVIYLQNGKKIVTEKARIGGMYVYYQKYGLKKIIKRSAVVRVEENAAVETISRKEKVAQEIGQMLEIEADSVYSAIFLFLTLLKGGFFVALLLGSVLIFKSYLGAAKIENANSGSRPVNTYTDSVQHDAGVRDVEDNSNEEANQEPSEGGTENVLVPQNDLEKVVQFFLKLYKVQIKVPKQAKAEWRLLEEKPGGGLHIYELSVQHESEVMKRRMTIGPLGEGSGSKSTCFYVIFGSHMVVKIPPKPVTDFYLYVEDILKEEKIVRQLQPRTCIIPKISVVLSKVYPFPESKHLNPEELENKYLKWIGDNATYQSYLKIGGSFVFFMDLSNYFFLESVIGELHDVGHKPYEEIMSHYELIWLPESFVQRYGPETEPVCYGMQEIYLKFENDLKQFLKAQHYQKTIPEYSLKRWFFTLIGGRAVEKDENEISGDLIAIINAWALPALKVHRKQTNLYRKTVLEQIRQRVQEQNKPKKESIVTNLLDLLVWLKDRQVALRDLKPDNLLVVGDKERYPQFLATVEKFSIGIIDLETAVSIDTSGQKEINQPRLGGTPFYATPSHLLKNDILQETYQDLAHILHMQDWYATIGMIYKTIAGKTLFENTAALFPTIFRAFRDMYAHPEDQTRTVATMCRLFWQKAQHEFREALDKKQAELKNICPAIPIAVVSILKPQLQAELRALLKAVNEQVQSQNYFQNEKKCKDLIAFSSERIKNLCRKWEAETKDAGNEEAQAVIDFFNELETLKRDAEKISTVIEQLNQSPPVMPADALLNEMFTHIYEFMNKPEWRTPSKPDAIAVDASGDDDISYEATI